MDDRLGQAGYFFDFSGEVTSERLFEEILLHPDGGRIDPKESTEWVVVFNDSARGGFLVPQADESFSIADLYQGGGTLLEGGPLDFLSITAGLVRQVAEKEFFRRVGPVGLFYRFQQLKREFIFESREENISAFCRAIQLLRASAASFASGLPPSVQIAELFEIITVLLDAHVAHIQGLS